MSLLALYPSIILFLLLLNPSALHGQDEEGPVNLDFLELASQGSGCPTGTVANFLSEDRDAITVTFNSFFAETNPPASLMDRKVCSLRFTVGSDSQWQLGVVGVEMRGYKYADPGANLRTGIRYLDENVGPRLVLLLDEEGHIDTDFSLSEQIPIPNVRWFGCEKERWFQLDNVIRAQTTANDALSFIAVDSVDGEIEQTLPFLWRPCDDQIRYFASCRVRLVPTDNPDQGVVRRFIIAGQAKTQENLLLKIRRKYNRRCSLPKWERRGLSCLPLRPGIFCDLEQF